MNNIPFSARTNAVACSKNRYCALIGALLLVSTACATASSSPGVTAQPSAAVPGRETRDVVSVKDFGARGDNAGNDAGAIQSAIDSLGPRGGKVYLPKGRYLIGTTRLSIVNNSTQLMGDGGDFDETAATDAPSLIRYTGKGAAITIGSAGMRPGCTVSSSGIWK